MLPRLHKTPRFACGSLCYQVLASPDKPAVHHVSDFSGSSQKLIDNGQQTLRIERLFDYFGGAGFARSVIDTE
jgi:hypothetical protein